MYNQYDSYYTEAQIDSICINEGIPNVYNWEKVGYKDWESQDSIYQYVYINDWDTIQYVYSVTPLDSLYKFKKRITKKIKK